MEQAATQCHPGDRVLVGGLGLGLILLALCKRGPSMITVYEIETRVASLVWPRLSSWCKVHYPGVILQLVIGDVFQATGEFDFVFMDIWDCADSRARPLVKAGREKAQTLVRPGGRIVCWQEDRIIGGQV